MTRKERIIAIGELSSLIDEALEEVSAIQHSNDFYPVDPEKSEATNPDFDEEAGYLEDIYQKINDVQWIIREIE